MFQTTNQVCFFLFVVSIVLLPACSIWVDLGCSFTAASSPQSVAHISPSSPLNLRPLPFAHILHPDGDGTAPCHEVCEVCCGSVCNCTVWYVDMFMAFNTLYQILLILFVYIILCKFSVTSNFRNICERKTHDMDSDRTHNSLGGPLSLRRTLIYYHTYNMYLLYTLCK